MSFLRPILYGAWASSCTWRVRCALHFKEIEFDVQPVSKSDLKSETYRDLNPVGQIPLFLHGQAVISESLAIIDFLEDEYPNTPKLYPADAFDRAEARSLTLNIVSGIQPLVSNGMLGRLAKNGVDHEKWAREFLQQSFSALEERLKRTSGRFSFGDEITAVDCCLQPQVFKAGHFINLEDFPTILRIDEALGLVPAFQRAHPFVQPDAPPEIRTVDEVNPLPAASAGTAVTN
ncbi:Maleylacetoacetate isomerase [Aphelenchoides fujianensis]|nr:Maleylacetoacetate isomerase [Aphelenchoides fujianensis]